MSTPFTVGPRPGAPVARAIVQMVDAADRAVPRAPAAETGRSSATWVPERGVSASVSTAERPDAAPVRRGPAPSATAGERHPSLVPFGAYLDDPAVTDLFVNGAAGLFVDR
ncbi:MAG TPA: hypothetical protein VEP72_03300, partial [Microbacterium sp.]|nr:hypothetical protein [Microbacterium sp.]